MLECPYCDPDGSYTVAKIHHIIHLIVAPYNKKYFLLNKNLTKSKFLKRWKCQITLPASCETCMHVKKQQLEPDVEQQTDSKLGKEYVKAVHCHPVYLTYMQSKSDTTEET